MAPDSPYEALPAAAGGPSPEAVRAHVRRITSSEELRRSERLCRFLSFTVERTLAGQAATLKEVVLATEVFDRRSTFDPKADSIVRVEARRLRKKLAAYYSGEGADDTLAIAYREGSYVPLIRPSGGPAARTPAAERCAVAILPFRNLGPGPEQDFFCEGVTEEVIHALATLPGIAVSARTSAFRLRDAEVREAASRPWQHPATCPSACDLSLRRPRPDSPRAWRFPRSPRRRASSRSAATGRSASLARCLSPRR